MSDPQEALPNELDRTLSTLQTDIQTELSRTQQDKLKLSEAIPGRQATAQEHLSRARAFYKKKEWARAFAEWDAVCAYLADGDAFRQRIALLRESHDNLAKVQRELIEIKDILAKRSAPGPDEKKFVQEAHDAATGEVKKAYTHLSQQLRTERTPKVLSFWWPVAAALLLLSVGFLGLSAQQAKARRVMRAEAELSGQALRLELMMLRTERDSLLKKVGSMEAEHRRQIAQLEGQNAGWRNAGREKIEELELQVQEAQLKARDLEKKIAERDRLIRTLSAR